jgi:hypothetical protein
VTSINYKTQLEKLLPFGMVATKQWLIGKGISRHFLDNGVKSGSIVSITPGLYCKAGVPVTWEGVVTSLQKMSNKPVHVGGMTALELSGLTHYLTSHGKKTIHLYSESKLPGWLNTVSVKYEFRGHGTRRMWLSDVMGNSKFVREFSWREDLPPFYASTPEKAYLEMLIEVPARISFEHADEIMQGLTNLSPNRLELLLSGCCHVKAKRLFFWFAKRHNYRWYQKLTVDDFDLGSGKRVIAQGGKLDTDFFITVPESMHE